MASTASALGRAMLGLALASALSPASRAGAQVLEIDAGGETTTFDRPMLFTATGAAPIELPDGDLPTPAAPLATSVWPLLDDAARRHGLPPALLRAVAWQESRGRTTAISRKGALGVMQLMPATAAALGVDPFDPHQNVRGGALYLRRQLDRFGSVPLALAAYNAGPAAVARFGGVPPYRETRAYVASILANWRPEAANAPLLSSIGVPPS